MAVRIRRLRGPGIAVLVLGLLAGPASASRRRTHRTLFVDEASESVRRQSSREHDSGSSADRHTWATSPLPGPNGPAGLAFDKDGNLYVSNINANTIGESSPTGTDLGDSPPPDWSSLALPSTGRQPLRGKHPGLKSLARWRRLGQLRHDGAEHCPWYRLRQKGQSSMQNAWKQLRLEGSLPVRCRPRHIRQHGIFLVPALSHSTKRSNLLRLTNFKEAATRFRYFLALVRIWEILRPPGLRHTGWPCVRRRGTSTSSTVVTARSGGSRTGADLGYFAITGMITPVGVAFGGPSEDEDTDD